MSTAWRAQLAAAKSVSQVLMSDISIHRFPQLGIWLSKAHAFMFLNQTDEARAIYLLHRGKMLLRLRWEDHIRRDFDRFRKRGLTHDLMGEIEKMFANSSALR